MQKNHLTVCFDVVTVTAAWTGPLIEAIVPMLRPACMNRSVPSLRSSVNMTSHRPSVKVKIGVALPKVREGQIEGDSTDSGRESVTIR